MLVRVGRFLGDRLTLSLRIAAINSSHRQATKISPAALLSLHQQSLAQPERRQKRSAPACLPRPWSSRRTSVKRSLLWLPFQACQVAWKINWN